MVGVKSYHLVREHLLVSSFPKVEEIPVPLKKTLKSPFLHFCSLRILNNNNNIINMDVNKATLYIKILYITSLSPLFLLSFTVVFISRSSR